MSSEAVAFLERIKRPNQIKNTSDMDLLDILKIEADGKPIKKRSCSSCVTDAFNVVRLYNGYPPIVKELDRRDSDKRIEMCKKCIHSQGSSVFLTCGTPVVGNTVPEGKLCGCFVYVKAKFKNENCPLGFWDK